MKENLKQNEVEQLLLLFNQEKLFDVIKKAKILIKKYPNSAFLLNILGVASARLNKLSNAKKYFQSCLKINSNFVEAHYNLGKTEKELEAWTHEYPDVAAIIETIAIKKSQEQTQDFATQMADMKREKAEVELLSLHPDFAEIRTEDDFHTWAEEQPKWIQDALYENETEARSASRAIDLY